MSYGDLIVKDLYSGQCVLGMDLIPSDGSVPSIFRSPFLRGTYMVYDQENDNIWLGESANCGSDIVAITKEGGVPRLPGCGSTYGAT